MEETAHSIQGGQQSPVAISTYSDRTTALSLANRALTRGVSEFLRLPASVLLCYADVGR